MLGGDLEGRGVVDVDGVVGAGVVVGARGHFEHVFGVFGHC